MSDIATVDHKAMANAIRALSMDAVQKANSGHPGMPMGMADVATVLFSKFVKFDPTWPDWPDRDRFVLSAGHGSMLLYALLYLTGYESPTLADIKNFRQLHSPCAGHPEFGEAPGIETTTGPLGQGLAMAVGMAMAERLEAARSGALADHYTYVIAGDGCLMEGVSHEAISMAGHLKLAKLIVLFDDNDISIDGPTSIAVSDDQKARFVASNWHVQQIDGHDPLAIERAIERAKEDPRPSMIACKTTIGYGAPTKAGTAATHGAPLGDEEIAGTREALGWQSPPFDIPAPILDAWREVGQRGAAAAKRWKAAFSALDDDKKQAFERRQAGGLPQDLDLAMRGYIRNLIAQPVKVATRKASEMALAVINESVEQTIGGSADLTGSNNTKTKQMDVITGDDFSGRYIHYGVREFGMAAAMNGMALHGGFIPYGATFLVFTDYCRPAIRLSALMQQRVIYVMTHDSIGLGEDGPTHQPIEHLASLRAMPNVKVYRPADAVETAECWALALADDTTPSVIALTRQGLPQVRLQEHDENICQRGGYILSDCDGEPQAVIIATGSEVHIALEAQEKLAAVDVKSRVISMPCAELFDEQDARYHREVLAKEGTVRVSIEAGTTYGWDRYVGRDGISIGIDQFGASAPANELYKYFGITAEAVVAAVRRKL